MDLLGPLGRLSRYFNCSMEERSDLTSENEMKGDYFVAWLWRTSARTPGSHQVILVVILTGLCHS